MTSVTIRAGSRDDCPEIVRLIKELAEFENLSHQVKLTAEELERDGFSGGSPVFHSLVADSGDGKLAAYCVYYYTYSTFQGKSLYLEDLYVTPSCRGKGIGTRVLKELSKIAVETKCARLDFIVLNWNMKAIEYYKRLGCEDLTQTEKWHLFRMGIPQLQSLVAN